MDGFLEINLGRLLRVLLKKWWLLLLVAVLGGGVAYTYTRYFITPLYNTNISVYVNNSVAGAANPDTITTGDLTASQRLVNTYVTIISSNTVLGEVSENINFMYTPEDIRSMMACAAVKDTEIFKVTIINKDQEVAAMIANAIADVVPTEIPKFIEGSSVKIVDYAAVPDSPFTPNFSRNAVLGFVAGFLLVALILMLVDVFDMRIKSEEDLEKLSDIPILGTIPDFSQNNKDKYRYEYTAPTDKRREVL